MSKIFCLNCQEETEIINARCNRCNEQICRLCGCTDSEPCQEVCEWIENDLCSNCDEESANILGENKIYVCLGSSEHLKTLRDISNSRRPHQSVYWTIRREALPGDKAVFYLTAPISAVVGFGTIVDSPWEEGESKWKDKYFTEINRIRIFDQKDFIKNCELRNLFPEWRFITQPRQSAVVMNEIKNPLWELLCERTG